MAGDEDERAQRDGQESRDADRDAILKRRQRFVALALGGLTSAAAVAGCAESSPSPCLDFPADVGPADSGADSLPMPCLGAPLDAGLDAGIDAEPMPCLEPPPPEDAGADAATDAAPTPCLDFAPVDAGDPDAG